MTQREAWWRKGQLLLIGFVVVIGSEGGLARAPQQKPPSGEALFPQVHYDMLLNELQILLIEHPQMSDAVVSLMFKSGAAFDRAGRSGTAAVTARAIWLGAEDLSRTTLMSRLEALEATVETEVTWDATRIVVRAPARGVPELLRLMARVVSRPTFDVEALAALRETVREEATARRRDPQRVADEELYRALYHPHPYARPASGVPEEIAQITPLDVARHHERFFIANNATLTVISPFSPATLMPLIRPTFGALLKGKIVPPTFLAPIPAQGVRVVLREFSDASLTQIRIGLLGPERPTDDHFPALLLARAIQLRYQKELAAAGISPAHTECRLELRAQRSAFVLSASLPAEHTVEAVQRAVRVLTEMRTEGPTEEEWAEAQRHEQERFSPTALSPRSVVEALERIELYGLGRDYVLRFAARLGRVTRDDVRRAAEKYLDPQRLTLVVLGRDGRMAEALKALGAVEHKTGS